MSIKCWNCGTLNDDGEKYCKNCGVELSKGPISDKDNDSQIISKVNMDEGDTTNNASRSPYNIAEDNEETPNKEKQKIQNAFKEGELILKSSEGIQKTFVLNRPKVILGRFDQSTGPIDIDVSDLPGSNYVSKHHAKIYFEDGTWKVSDLGSTNGTFIKEVNDDDYSSRIQEPMEIKDGTEIAFGNMIFVFRYK